MLSRPLNRWRDTRVEKNLAFQYTAPGGERVEIPRFVRPCGVLQVAQNASFGQIKEAYGMLANTVRDRSGPWLLCRTIFSRRKLTDIKRKVALMDLTKSIKEMMLLSLPLLGTRPDYCPRYPETNHCLQSRMSTAIPCCISPLGLASMTPLRPCSTMVSL